MILGEGIRTAGTAATLDDLFRRVGDRHRPMLADRGVTLNATTATGTPLNRSGSPCPVSRLSPVP